MTADYSAFSYTFTQTPPSSGPYTTIYFNDPALTGLEGGIATGDRLARPGHHRLDDADRRRPAGHARRHGLGQRRQPAGQAGEPAATSADFVALSATIAAHELGHLSGLEHGDSYGPIGSGIYVGVNPDLYRPPYPGPTDADETIRHIMASGASVNETLFDAIDDPFFGEREAIKLAFGEDGTPTNEQTTPALLDGRRPADRARAAGRARHRPRGRRTPTRSSTSRPPTSSATSGWMPAATL